MARVQIVNNARGRGRLANKIMVEAVSTEIESIARREATKNGIDVDREPKGLMRAMMRVLSCPELLAEAGRLAREKLERAGAIQKEDERIVKQRGKAT